MSERTDVKRYLLHVVRGVYVLTTCTIVLLALSVLTVGGH